MSTICRNRKTNRCATKKRTLILNDGNNFHRLQVPIANNSRVSVMANQPFPLNKTGDLDFEQLVYWLYKAEIKEGNRKDKYDDCQRSN